MTGKETFASGSHVKKKCPSTGYRRFYKICTLSHRRNGKRGGVFKIFSKPAAAGQSGLAPYSWNTPVIFFIDSN
jgi:hypothetical protein